MKKLVSILGVLCLVLSLVACGNDNSSVNSQSANINIEADKNKVNYHYGDSIKILNVIDVGGTIDYINPIDEAGWFCLSIDALKKTIYCNLKGDISENYKNPCCGFYLYEDNDKYGLIDDNGNVVLNAEYDSLYESRNYICARKDGMFYIFNNDLKTIFEHKSGKSKRVKVANTEWSCSSGLSNGVINLTNDDGKWGYVDLSGKTIIDYKYDYANNFNNYGYASVAGKNKQGDYKFGLLDSKGKLIIDYQYDSPLSFRNGISKANKNGVGYYINIKNEQILNGLLFEQTENFCEGLATVKMNGKWGYIDANGQEIVPCVFDYAREFSNGIALAAYKNHIIVLTYLDTLPYGFTNADVEKSYQKLGKIDGEAYWTNIRRKLESNVNTKNWSDNEYSDDFNYTLTYKEVQPDSWYVTDAGVWYYFENDRTTKKTGWYDEPKDGQRYYLNPSNGVMATGWTEIDGDMYYFNEDHSSIPNWYYIPESDSWESHGRNVKALGSMFRNETTPDGKQVDKDGKLIK